jgi:hypothetical protein
VRLWGKPLLILCSVKRSSGLLEHDPWLVRMLEHHQRLLIAQQKRIAERSDWQPPDAHLVSGSCLALKCKKRWPSGWRRTRS